MAENANKRKRVVQVRLTDEEKAKIKKEAENAHLTLASFIRFKLLSDAE